MIKCVVPVSGGKDSQACLKLALQQFDQSEVIGLFCDTKFEHPMTYAHVERMHEMYGVDIRVVNRGDVLSLVRKYKRFPGGGARFCTDELKIKAGVHFYKQLASEQGCGFQVWYGMRLGESHERNTRYFERVDTELYPPHEVIPSKYPKYLEKMGVMFRMPVLQWSGDDVLDFLDGEQSPLYAAGFDRVGCFPCLAAGDQTKERAFAFDDFGKSQRIAVVQIGHDIGKNPFTSLGGRMRNLDAMVSVKNDNQPDLFDAPPCAICAI